VEGDQLRSVGKENGRDQVVSTNGRVFLGDLTRALVVAGSPGGSDWSEIARMLGFERERIAAPDRQMEAPANLDAASPAATRRPDATAARPVAEPNSPIGELLEFDLDHQPSQSSSLPKSAAPIPERARRVSAVLQPLLDPLWQRGILIESLGKLLPEGEIDVLAAVEAIARCDAMAEVPREHVQSVSKGCQVLIDTSQGMRPFAKDARELVKAVRKAVGGEHTQVLTFANSPLNGVLTESYDDEPYRAPDNGALVLAVSDLGAAGTSGAVRRTPLSEWRATARRIRDAGSQLIVLNPYAPHTWPSEADSVFPIVHWDRSTRASDVRRKRRRFR